MTVGDIVYWIPISVFSENGEPVVLKAEVLSASKDYVRIQVLSKRFKGHRAYLPKDRVVKSALLNRWKRD